MILPSLYRQLSGCEKIFEKWCFDEQEEEEEASNFCLTTWVHHKIIAIDTFWTQFCSFTKTALYVCIESITFGKSQPLLGTHLLFLQSQKLILLFDDNDPNLYHLSLLHILTLCMMFYQLHNMNNKVITEIHHFWPFPVLFRSPKQWWNYALRTKRICNQHFDFSLKCIK